LGFSAAAGASTGAAWVAAGASPAGGSTSLGAQAPSVIATMTSTDKTSQKFFFLIIFVLLWDSLILSYDISNSSSQ
jgi:hypothetical protein